MLPCVCREELIPQDFVCLCAWWQTSELGLLHSSDSSVAKDLYWGWFWCLEFSYLRFSIFTYPTTAAAKALILVGDAGRGAVPLHSVSHNGGRRRGGRSVAHLLVLLQWILLETMAHQSPNELKPYLHSPWRHVGIWFIVGFKNYTFCMNRETGKSVSPRGRTN